MITFQLGAKYHQARTGILTTPHGEIHTPVFMPVGTGGSVKSLTSDQIRETGSQIILGNTYHLYLRPGMDVMQSFKGIHHFMNWKGPILTDSGGFQIFSLSKNLVKVREEGVTFTSHIDGSSHEFSPEKAIEIEHIIGADIIMQLDHITKDSASWLETKEAVERTIRWLDRCIVAWKEHDPDRTQSLFGIVQGGTYKDLRIESVKQTLERELEGIAIGGESIGYNKGGTQDILEWVMPYIPETMPRYSMGVGDIDDIFEVVERGVDMFDCVSPTRLARNGALLLSPMEGGNKKNKYRLNISKMMYAKDENPIDRSCDCYTCKNYSRGYITHLFRSKELLANTLATIHNVTMMARLTRDIRSSIEDGTFDSLKSLWLG